jgi:hypothetical protein
MIEVEWLHAAECYDAAARCAQDAGERTVEPWDRELVGGGATAANRTMARVQPSVTHQGWDACPAPLAVARTTCG